MRKLDSTQGVFGWLLGKCGVREGVGVGRGER